MDSAPLVERKRNAAREFLRRLLESGAGELVAKVVLFGSVGRGDPREESDVDIVVVAKSRADVVQRVSSDIGFELAVELGEGIEPVVHCLHEWRSPHNLFLWGAKESGEEIYSMGSEELVRAEAEGYLALAQHYLEGASRNISAGDPRLAVDAGYNAAELCVKAMLALSREEIPRSHRGTVIGFGQVLVQPGLVPSELGRRLNRALDLRSRARYEFDVLISNQDAEEVIDLARSLLEAAGEKLRGGEDSPSGEGTQ